MPEVSRSQMFRRCELAPREGGPPLGAARSPEGLGSVLFDSDERAARADLRRQIAAVEAELGASSGSAFPRTGIDFGVPAPGGGPRVLSVNELERVATRSPPASRTSAAASTITPTPRSRTGC